MIGELGDSHASEGLDDCPVSDVCNLRPLHVRSCGVGHIGRIGRVGRVGAAEEDADTPRGTCTQRSATVSKHASTQVREGM